MDFKLKLIDRASFIRLVILTIAIASIAIFGWSLTIWMPGQSYLQVLPPLSASEIKLRDRLKQDVEALTVKIGRRNVDNYQNLVAAKDFLDRE